MEAYGKKRAEDSMVNVPNSRCLHASCTWRPSFSTGVSKVAAYCRQHAEDGMVGVRARRCSHASCSRCPIFNTESSKTVA